MQCNKFAMAFVVSMMSAVGAQAAPIGIDGLIGTEWAGVTPTTMSFDPAAPLGNFGNPGTSNHVVGYDVYYRADSSFLYGLVKANGDSTGLNFANAYYNTNLVGGSDFGIEVTSSRGFTPGVAGYYDITPYFSFAQSAGNVNAVIEWAIAWSFFQNDPLNVLPADTNVAAGIQFRTLQAFGYSATGGDLSGARFGTVALAANEVPEPGALALGGLAMLAALGLRRRA